MGSHRSEIVLIVLLLLIVAATRIYYGGGHGVMVVWKGEVTFINTFVNLSDLLEMPRATLAHDHPKIYYQLEEMGLLDTVGDINPLGIRRKPQVKRPGEVSSERSSDSQSGKGPDSNSEKVPDSKL